MQAWMPVVPQGRQVPAEQNREASLQLSSGQHALPLSPQSMASQMLSLSSKPELQGETPSSAPRSTSSFTVPAVTDGTCYE